MEFKDILIQAGYKPTGPRLAVLECLNNQKKIISARDLFKKIKKFDQASVYRALSIFEELNIVGTEMVGKEKLYCLAKKPHHHIICRQCGYNESFPCEEKEIRQFTNFSNINHQLTLTGVCNKCKQ
jgi:Fur family ferric uptake transcriptional regulator